MNTHNLEKGKWYMMIDSRDTDQVAARFDYLNEYNGEKYFHFTEFIRKTNRWNKFSGDWYMPPDPIEASIEELRHWLPAGHESLGEIIYQIY